MLTIPKVGDKIKVPTPEQFEELNFPVTEAVRLLALPHLTITSVLPINMTNDLGEPYVDYVIDVAETDYILDLFSDLTLIE